MFKENAGAATGAIGTVNMLGFSVMISITGWFVTNVGVDKLMVGVVFVGLLLSFTASIFKKNFDRLIGGQV